MIKTTQIVKNSSVECLLQLWSQRYIPNLSSLSLLDNPSLYDYLKEFDSPKMRALTAEKLKDNVLDIKCHMAWIQTKTLYSYIPNVLDLNEARRITQFAFRIYKKLLQIYEQQSGIVAQAIAELSPDTDDFLAHFVFLPAIEELAYTLEPTLMIFQEQHLASKDWRSLGFMTTQLNFSNQLILKKLTPIEQVLIAVYLKFVEEQVAMPWQRVCAASAEYELESPTFIIVEQMLPAADEIAQNVYRQLVQLLPHHHSRRGNLSAPGIKHSCIRDLTMFQAYLWLCFLEGNLAPLEEELLPLCAMVVESVGIKWEITKKWCQLLANEVISHLKSAEQKALLLPYIQGMQEVFFKHRMQLGFQE